VSAASIAHALGDARREGRGCDRRDVLDELRRLWLLDAYADYRPWACNGIIVRGAAPVFAMCRQLLVVGFDSDLPTPHRRMPSAAKRISLSRP
jgi:hypothetical protein